MSVTRTCRISGKVFTISDFEIALLDKISPVIGNERFDLPVSIISPEERFKRKLLYKNYLSLFNRTDSETLEPTISGYPPDSKYTIYTQSHWWNGNWNPMNYAIVYDEKQKIAEQIATIWHTVPVPALDNAYLEQVNSEFINGNGPSKDCYLTSNSAYNEKCLYGWNIFHSNNILNSNYVRNSEFSSHAGHIWKSYNVHFAWNISECRDSWYIFSCEGSAHLLGCVGLKNQQYHILNTPCNEDEYKSTLEKLKIDGIFRNAFEKKVKNLINHVGVDTSITLGSVGSTGDFCYDSKNAIESFNVGDCEDVAFIRDSFNTKDSAHVSMWGDGTSLSYDCIDVGLNISNVYFSTACWEGARYIFYSHKCNNCQYIFGCSGLRNKSYCIFNKQYTKDEWELLVKKIIQQMQKEGSWGEFLDPKFAPFAYNESLGNTFYPLMKEEVLKQGFRWSDRKDTSLENISKTLPGERLPYDIRDIPDDVLNWALICMKTGKPYKIQPLELDMHRKFGIPLPRTHPLERIGKLFEWDKRQFSFDF